MSASRSTVLTLSTLVIAALACNLPGGGGGADTSATELAETASAQVTAALAQTQAAAEQTQQALPELPTETTTLESTPTQTATVTVTPILTPFITTNVNSNVRGGPGTVYDIHGVLLQGQTADILGRNNSSTWWVIAFEAGPDGKGWIADSIVTVSGDTTNIPIVVPPPTPTPSPTGDWQGTWVTNCGVSDCSEMQLNQSGNNVTGTYADGDGTLSGTISDNRLTGTWSRNSGSGTFDFWLTGDADGFRGSWDKVNAWCGHREGESDPSPCGVSAWYGTWSTDCGAASCGNMTLSQDGTSIEGTYAGGDGTITGSIAGNELTGTWSRNNSSGALKFFMLSNGEQFNGNFGGSFAWCGYRGGAGLPGQCLAP